MRAAAYVQSRRVVLHLVNYDRQEGASETNRTGPEGERPRSVEKVVVNMRLPPGRRAKAVTLHAPDQRRSSELEFQRQNGHVLFTVPRIHVYGVISVETQALPQS